MHRCSLKKINLWIGHRIMEYVQLEGTHQDHQVQLLTLCRIPQESHYGQGKQTPLYKVKINIFFFLIQYIFI